MATPTLPVPQLPTPGLATPKKVVKATLKALPNGPEVPVHFNPASLVYTVENSAPQQGGDPKRRQYAASFTGKLTMDLQFDTTTTGSDVRNDTGKVAAFMQSSAGASKTSDSGGATNAPAPAVLSFDWGSYHFQGFMESYKETIDFFSAEGVPLRSLVSIGLARQDNVFDPGGSDQAAVGGALQPSGGGAGTGSVVPTPQNGNPSNIASQGGDPRAGRALAAANGLDSARFTGGAALQVGAGIQLNAAVGFVASASVSAGAGIGISGGAGIGISGGIGFGASAGAGIGVSAGASAGFGLSAGAGAPAGFGLSAGAGASAGVGAGAGAFAGASANASFGASAGASFGASASFGAGASASFGANASAGAFASAGAGAGAFASAGVVSFSSSVGVVSISPAGGALFGSRASAGVPATYGAFAGLEAGRAPVSTTVNLNPVQMMPVTVGSNVSTGANASFGLGGVALAQTGFSTNVGASYGASYSVSRVIFDGD